MGLRDHAFQVEYRSGRDNLIRDFYHAALGQATQYWRAVGFFSSSALEAIGQPLGDFVARGGAMRLITSVRLEDEDIRAIERGLEKRTVCEDRLCQQVREAFSSPLGQGSMLLASLLEMGRLEVQVAVPSGGYGIYHEKVGVFLSDDGDYVAFSGSSNESRTGLEVNYECVDVYPSWGDPTRASRKREHFELLWQRRAPGVETIPFPEAARREILERCREAQAVSAGTTLLPDRRWRHQEQAIKRFLESERGILEMATGTGKTRTALRICEQLVDEGAVGTIVVSADGNDLLDQWYSQLLVLTKRLVPRFAVVRDYHIHRQRDRFLLDPRQTILLSSRQALPPALAELGPAEGARTLLIHDEVHRLGSPGNRQALAGRSDSIRYRLGLSATPDREYDEDGNRFVEQHIGPVIMQFELADAIRQGILAPFNYYPLEYIPDEEDRERIQQVYRRVAARRESGNPMSPEEIWIELARVHKTSRAKLPVFEEFIQAHSGLLQRCIIFVETKEYGEEVLPTVHRYRHDFHTYYAEEDPTTLRRFADGGIECLLTCHRLSEGIDIRSIETVILFSSARARLETIQRIGRCLRINPDNPRKRANVIDFVRVSEANGESGNPDQERRDWLQSLSGLHAEEDA